MANELSQLVKEMHEGVKEELKELIPSFDLSPDISDEKIKKAIRDLPLNNRVRMELLYRQFGYKEVLNFISEFWRGKEG